MATMTTVLTEYSDLGNSRTYTAPGHLTQKPRIVIQKRVTPSAPGASSELNLRVVQGTTDVSGAPIANKVMFEVNVRLPNLGQSADIVAARDLFKEIIASDNFTNSLSTLNWIK